MGNWRGLANSPPQVRRGVARRALEVLCTFLGLALLMFVPAGSVSWFYAWLYLGLYMLVTLVALMLMPLELVAERGSPKANVEKWDRALTPFMGAFSFGMYLTAGLDFRWSWSPSVPTALHLCGVGVFALGLSVVVWAMLVNRFFSTEVRIQSERGHTVCTTGPYAHVRHPGYLGMALYTLATPWFLGSLWAMIPALVVAALFVVRTRFEDETLLEKLPGYRAYAARIKFRLIPWVW